ncbi:sensor histidine kinase [Streptomyces sp. NBC_00388]|uniref:sensor histidine kinase n=1 Tax=Streptomyces sp. NBC_00388 TaxID=2975735 RepID=UPI002E1AD15E
MPHIDAGPEAAARSLLAREVHDRIGTGLALALRRLDLLEMTAEGLGPAERGRVADVRTALLDTLGVAREVASGLRRPPAARPGLERSLTDFLESMAPCAPYVQVRVDGDDSWIPAQIADEVFVIVRESLRNVLAHARARHARARIVIAPHEVHAQVVDDGFGFDPATVRRLGRTNGLLGMEERAAALAGTASISSAPGRGTRVAVWIPIKESSIHG